MHRTHYVDLVNVLVEETNRRLEVELFNLLCDTATETDNCRNALATSAAGLSEVFTMATRQIARGQSLSSVSFANRAYQFELDHGIYTRRVTDLRNLVRGLLGQDAVNRFDSDTAAASRASSGPKR